MCERERERGRGRGRGGNWQRERMRDGEEACGVEVEGGRLPSVMVTYWTGIFPEAGRYKEPAFENGIFFQRQTYPLSICENLLFPKMIYR